MPKTLKFESKLVPLILSGKKTATWRFGHDELRVGDSVDLCDSGTGKKFVTTKITEIFEKRFKDLTEADKIGHEKYSSDEEMFATFAKYYKTEVDQDHCVRVIKFELAKPS